MTHELDVYEDPWHWLVVYADGEAVPEYEDDIQNNFGETIQAKPVEKIALIPQRPGLQPFVLLVPQDARPIVFRARTATVINNPDDEVPPPRLFTGFGYQKTIDGRNEQCLLAIFDDGSVLLADERNRLP